MKIWVGILCWSLLTAAGWGEAITADDDMGTTVELPAPPQRIVSLAPSNTEILFAVGLGDRVVGVTEFCNYPAAAEKIERVAGFNSMSVEKIVAARPDLVLASRGNQREGVEALRKLGIPVFALDIQSVEQLLEGIIRVGRLGGVEERARQVSGELRIRVDRVRARADSLNEPTRIMWGYWSEPIYTAGANTMIDDVFRLAGGINVGRQAPGAWPQVGLETVVTWAPEVIITTYHPAAGDEGALKADIERLQQTDGWKEVPAVRDGRVYYVEGDILNRPGPRLIDALEQIAGFLDTDAGR